MKHLIQDGPTTQDCPYCELPIDGASVGTGGFRMHPDCNDRFNSEMAEAYPEDVIFEEPSPELFPIIGDQDWNEWFLPVAGLI